MRETTQRLWDKQNQHPGDRLRLFLAVGKTFPAQSVLYPGCYVDVAPSFAFQDVTYVDSDHRALGFFKDIEGVREIIENEVGAPTQSRFTFLHSDYAELALPAQSFDLLVSLYAGFVSEHCTRFLRIGGHLLVNPSHGDAALASIDPRYALAGVIVSRAKDYLVSQVDLALYMQPKKPTNATREALFSSGRGIAYTRPAFAYVFQRIA